MPSNIAPGPMARLFELVADAKDLEAARALYLEWLPIIQAVFGQRYVGGTKSLLNHMGLPVGRPRPPLPAEDDRAMRGLVERFGLRVAAA